MLDFLKAAFPTVRVEQRPVQSQGIVNLDQHLFGASGSALQPLHCPVHLPMAMGLMKCQQANNIDISDFIVAKLSLNSTELQLNSN